MNSDTVVFSVVVMTTVDVLCSVLKAFMDGISTVESSPVDSSEVLTGVVVVEAALTPSINIKGDPVCVMVRDRSLSFVDNGVDLVVGVEVEDTALTSICSFNDDVMGKLLTFICRSLIYEVVCFVVSIVAVSFEVFATVEPLDIDCLLVEISLVVIGIAVVYGDTCDAAVGNTLFGIVVSM